ncbi:hypothetical protein ABE509_07215 [[Pseudomonas] hibiscicola]|uniref:hypothetical protein n=1 Tax=Stenotrophomonas TaxID=40323 RepID=UPI001D1257F0|nr:hypothetical protein [Stenotrophomonas sp. Sm10]MDQ7310283.1 hypothetical protein [Stenotrophomonas sp. Sm10]UXB23737.1 hypothetical protein K7567_17665 [Stenotrophomonas maltophilia]
MSTSTLSTPTPDKGSAAMPRIAVVIPCYRVRAHVMQVIAGIGAEVGWIIAVAAAR